MDKESLLLDINEDGDISSFENNNLVQHLIPEFLEISCNKEEKNMLQEAIDAFKKDQEITKGTIFSMQRQISLDESQLKKRESEKEALQNQLKERLIQIQAMSAKFSNLREEGKREEMMAAIEKDNYNLRELVLELKSELMIQSNKIGELKMNNKVLQEQCATYQTQIKTFEEDKDKIDRKLKDLEFSEQHMKIALERLHCRFERFHSKIIQATYSAPEVALPSVELTDDDVLRALQNMIEERSVLNQKLTQKGPKVSLPQK